MLFGRTTFRQAVKLMDIPVEEVLIPYEGTQLPGYYYRPDNSHKPRPTLIVHGGYDSTGASRPLRQGILEIDTTG